MPVDAPQPAMLNRRSLPGRAVAGLRWRFLFWLFAIFAGVEAPLGASEATSGRPGLASSALKAQESGIGVADLARAAVEAEAAGLAESQAALSETRPFDAGGADGLVPAPLLATPEQAQERSGGTPTVFAFVHHAAGFSSRAPPRLV